LWRRGQNASNSALAGITSIFIPKKASVNNLSSGKQTEGTRELLGGEGFYCIKKQKKNRVVLGRKESAPAKKEKTRRVGTVAKVAWEAKDGLPKRGWEMLADERPGFTLANTGMPIG